MGFHGRVRTLQRRPANVAEARCWDILCANGWEPWKRGWPDFIAFKGDDLVVIEVKPTADYQLKRTQERVMRALAKRGVRCIRRVAEAGFKEVKA